MLNDTYYSNGRVPWVSDITALSVEKETEGDAVATTDAAGRRIDLRQLSLLTNIFSCTWYTTLIVNKADASVMAYLRLHPDGEAALQIGYENGGPLEDWLGTYEVFAAAEATISARHHRI